MDIVLNVLYAILSIAAIVAVIFITNWVRNKTNLIKDQTARDLVSTLVSAAEQKYLNDFIEDRKEYVMDTLYEIGIDYDDAEIDALVESAVFDLNNYFVTRIKSTTCDNSDDWGDEPSDSDWDELNKNISDTIDKVVCDATTSKKLVESMTGEMGGTGSMDLSDDTDESIDKMLNDEY